MMVEEREREIDRDEERKERELREMLYNNGEAEGERMV